MGALLHKRNGGRKSANGWHATLRPKRITDGPAARIAPSIVDGLWRSVLQKPAHQTEFPGTSERATSGSIAHQAPLPTLRLASPSNLGDSARRSPFGSEKDSEWVALTAVPTWKPVGSF